MLAAQDRAVFEHPRATWIDPSNGRQVDEPSLMHEIAARQVVLLGETHTVAEIHRWQLHVATILRFIRPDIAVGFEMFPRRVQPVLDEWVAGELSSQEFLEKVDWENNWGYDAQLYSPLFHFCRQQLVPMLALNCNRPLVTRVGKEGWDAIPEDERDGLSPAAEATPAYRSYLFGLGLNRSPAGPTSAMDPKLDRFVRAQQTWDRAFACNIARAIDQPNPPLVIGIIGRGHLEYGHGTPFQLRDLGIPSPAVLLPATGHQHDAIRIGGIADAIFRLDEPEPAAPMPPRMQTAMDKRRQDSA